MRGDTQWEGQDRDVDKRDRWRGIRLRRWPLIEKGETGGEGSAPAEGERVRRKLEKTKIRDNRQDRNQTDEPEHRTRERERNWRDRDGEEVIGQITRRHKRQVEKDRLEKVSSKRDTDGEETVGRTTQRKERQVDRNRLKKMSFRRDTDVEETVGRITRRQERQVEKNQLRKVSFRRDTERDIKNRQVERWRQKIRRQEQRDVRRTERGGEETKIGDKKDEGSEQREGEDTKTGLRRSVRERKTKIKWCIWCGIGCRGGEGERCKDKRQRRERKKQGLGDKGSGDTGNGTSAQDDSPGEGGKQVEKVGHSVSSPQTRTNFQGDKDSQFEEGGKVERDVNRGKERGIGREAQDKKEVEREGDVLEREEKGRGKKPLEGGNI